MGLQVNDLCQCIINKQLVNTMIQSICLVIESTIFTLLAWFQFHQRHITRQIYLYLGQYWSCCGGNFSPPVNGACFYFGQRAQSFRWVFEKFEQVNGMGSHKNTTPCFALPKRSPAYLWNFAYNYCVSSWAVNLVCGFNCRNQSDDIPELVYVGIVTVETSFYCNYNSPLGRTPSFCSASAPESCLFVLLFNSPYYEHAHPYLERASSFCFEERERVVCLVQNIRMLFIY